MSEINNGILGKMTGSIGNITGKVRKGKNILALKPASVTVANDPESVARREKFAQAVKFAKMVNEQMMLKLLWQKITPYELTPFNNIVKVNYPSFQNGMCSAATTMTPLLGFPITTAAASFTQSGISFDVNPLANAFSFDTTIEAKLKPCVILSFSTPLNSALAPTQYVSVDIAAAGFVTTDTATFSASFNDYIKSLFDNYSNRSALVSLVTLDTNDAPVNYTQTVII